MAQEIELHSKCMSTEQLVAQFLARGGEVRRLPKSKRAYTGTQIKKLERGLDPNEEWPAPQPQGE